MKLVMLLLAAPFLFAITWTFYLAVMQLIPHRGKLTGFPKYVAYGFVLPVGLLLDAALNILVCMIFLRVPHDKLLTGSLKRFLISESGWREKVAVRLCSEFLNPFDPSGTHC